MWNVGEEGQGIENGGKEEGEKDSRFLLKNHIFALRHSSSGYILK